MEKGCDCNLVCNSVCEGRPAGNMCVPINEAESGVPLVAAKIGDSGKIVRVSGKQDTRKFLCELGFVIGAHVSVVNENSGNMILEVKGSRIAMDRAVASKIFFAPA